MRFVIVTTRKTYDAEDWLEVPVDLARKKVYDSVTSSTWSGGGDV